MHLCYVDKQPVMGVSTIHGDVAGGQLEYKEAAGSQSIGTNVGDVGPEIMPPMNVIRKSSKSGVSQKPSFDLLPSNIPGNRQGKIFKVASFFSDI